MTHFTSQTNEANWDINQPARCSGQHCKTGLSSAAAGSWVQRLLEKPLRAGSHLCCLGAGTARAWRGFIPQASLGYYLLSPAAPGHGCQWGSAWVPGDGSSPRELRGWKAPPGQLGLGHSSLLPRTPLAPRAKAWHSRVGGPAGMGGEGRAGSSPTPITTLLPRAKILILAVGSLAEHRSAPNPPPSMVTAVSRPAESKRALPASLGLCNYLLWGQGNPH